MMLLETLFIDEENKDSDDEIASIKALADKILSANENDEEYDEIEYDEDDDDEDDGEEDEDEGSNEVIETVDKNEAGDDNKNSGDENKIDDDIIDESIQLDDKEAIKEAIELLNKKKPHEIEKSKEPFGKYEIIYNDGASVPEKYTRIVENEKIDENKHEPIEVTINKIRASVDKFPDERAQIQEFLASNGKEAKISEIRGLIEASLFVLGEEGLNAYDLKKVTGLSLSIVNNILEEMVFYYQKK